MAELSVLFQRISFSYPGAAQALIDGMTVHFPRGWTGIVGPNGAGKSTILKLAAGILEPQEGRVIAPDSTIYCEQRTDDVPLRLRDLMEATDGHAARIRDRLRVERDWVERWTTLSHGERKRAQIAAALWQAPDVLALDEPTNHLDAEARELLFQGLSAFRGVGMLVSHDRELLDGLCRQCLFVESRDAMLRPGNYSQGLELVRHDEISARRQRMLAKAELDKLKRETDKRRDAALQADRKRSKKGLAPKDHDTRAKINLARVSGKDGVAGKRLSQLEGRMSQARAKLEGIKAKKVITLGIWMQGAKSERNTLFNLSAGSLSLGGHKRLDYPALVMRPDDRIALTGANGCGKSTLISHIVRSLDLKDDRLTYIPQEIDLHASQAILERVKNLPNEKLGRMLTIVSRLGSSAERLLESEVPSPGEIRKILLAFGIVNEPHLIIMDEPTNHLDLPSIECLEEALADCPCGLLLVSHDRRFLRALTSTQWRISEDSEVRGRLLVRI